MICDKYMRNAIDILIDVSQSRKENCSEVLVTANTSSGHVIRSREVQKVLINDDNPNF